MDKFSERHGFEPTDAEIKIRHDAPGELRSVVVDIAYEAGLDPHSMRSIACKVLRTTEDSSNWSAFPNVDGEVRDHLASCEWYEVYDIIEAAYRNLLRGEEKNACAEESSRAEYFSTELNKYFRKKGIGWQSIAGNIEVRGAESFEAAVKTARESLKGTGRDTAASEIHEALKDLSRRPTPDLTGALHHALAALECVARDVTGDLKPTLGPLVGKHPTLIPAPLDKAVEKIWGFASERGRHLKEGGELEEEEVELAVATSAAVITYLVKRCSRTRPVAE